MIRYTSGNILSAEVDALVNTVNCVGVMGRGIALQFKNAFPSNFKAYEAACKIGEVQPGRIFVHETRALSGPKFIMNFPTKRHWRGKSRIEDIVSGLSALVAEVKARNIRSIAIPPLGSGLGGLNWADVRPLIAEAFEHLSGVETFVFEPGGAPSTIATSAAKVPSMTPGRAALVGLMDRYLGGLMDPFVTLIELHKLMYFMQTAGQPLNLQYSKGHYGPYAEKLRHVLRAIEGHMIAGYEDGGDQPGKQLQMVPGASEEAARFLHDDHEAHARFERVARLVEGFETPFGLELLATVHWVAGECRCRDVDDVVRGVHGWSERKKQFTPRQVHIAFDTLSEQGWLN